MIGEGHGDLGLMARLAGRLLTEAARSFREGIGEYDPLWFDDLAIHALLPFVDSLGPAHAKAPSATDLEVHLADRAGIAMRSPPSHQVFGLAPCFEDDASRRVEDSGDGELGSGGFRDAIFGHCCRPSSATRADTLPDGRSSRPRSGDSGRANPRRP